jgi:hypothetical protein
MMNRQQRRQAARQMISDQKEFRKVLHDPKERTKNEGLIRQSFQEGQIMNNHDWAVRLERLLNVKGIGVKLLDKIFSTIEEPLTVAERQKARDRYEKGVEYIDFGDKQTAKKNNGSN